MGCRRRKDLGSGATFEASKRWEQRLRKTKTWGKISKRGKRFSTHHKLGKMFTAHDSHTMTNAKELDDVFMPQISDLADFRFRSELIRMMGSEEIRLNDQEWSKKFQDKLREDYDRLLDQQERNLAKAERHRVYRLKMGGIIRPGATGKEEGKTDDSFDCEFHLHKTPHALAHGQIDRKSADGRRKRSAAPVGETDIFVNEESSRREKEMEETRHEKIYHPCDDVATQIDHIAHKLEEEEKSNEFGDIASSLSSSMDHHSDLKDGEKRSIMERRAERQRRICGKVPPNIVRLYEEETTTGLYKIAAEILSSGKVEDSESRK